jgi:MFS family permease
MVDLATRLKQNNTAWLVGLSASLLLALQPFSSYIASLPFIRDEWQMSNVQASMVFSSYLVGYALSSLVLLPLTDRLSPARLLKGGILVIALSNLLFPLLATNFWSGAALRFAAGAGHVAAYIPGVQLISERYAGARRGTAVAIFVGAGYAGTTLSYTVMGLLLSYTASWRLAYFITALVSVIGVFVAFALIRDEAQVGEKGTAPLAGRPGKGWLDLKVLSHRSIGLVILAYALHTAELYLARLWFPLLLGATLAQQGRNNLEATALAATLSGLMFMMGTVGVFVGGSLSDYLGRSRAAVLIFGISGLCSFGAGWLGAWPSWLISLGFIYGFTTAADSAIYSTAVTELSPPNRIGSTQAVQSFIGFAIGAIVPVIAGSILDWAGTASGWRLAFSFNGLLAIIGVIVLILLYRLPEARQMAGGKK